MPVSKQKKNTMTDSYKDDNMQTVFGLELYWQKAMRSVERLQKTQAETIRSAARACVDCIERDGVIHAYGTGHSRAFAMELAGRAGGLVPVNRLDLEDLVLHAGWSPEVAMHPDIERNLQAGEALLNCYHIEPQDIFLICSNAGINVTIVEVARQIKQRGHMLIAVTSLEHTWQMSPRHASGQRLCEIADIVIDNQSPFGDALLTLPDGSVACAISSITGALIAQALTAEIIGQLMAKGQDVPVFLSSNVPGGIERNAGLIQRYSDRIRPV
ncbi:UPF0309 protein [Ktedonospora formicarum]|uniref:UPF0309 protein n=2 Tax=Ktedonospora formicarum TaxID=2778364 RepID=A0A8J3HSV9_9CHLR|nr:UPF0309 protein [Ktedonospora formicarum]